MESARQLVLASGSPRRRDLLAGLGLRFGVRPVEVDESPRPGEAPERYVMRLAQEKASFDGGPGELVLGADTTVVLDGELLGKPAGPGEAEAMLARLAGRRHEVLTGVALWDHDARRLAAELDRTEVWIAPLDADEIAWYVATGEPLDKAGAYAAQGIGGLYVEALAGSYSNVVGLPLHVVRRLFAELGHDLHAFR